MASKRTSDAAKGTEKRVKAHQQSISLPTGAALQKAVFYASAYATTHGMIMASPSGPDSVHIPFSLFPTPLPRSLFEEAKALGPSFGTLTNAIARNAEFLHSALDDVVKEDPFTGKLLEIFDQHGAEPKQPLMLGLLRSDYMISDNALRQIELNCIASSFGAAAVVMGNLHRFVLHRERLADTAVVASRIPSNQAGRELVEGLATAWSAVGRPSAVVMMVVDEGDRNIFDQWWLDCWLWESYVKITKKKRKNTKYRHAIRMVRHTLKEVAEHGVLDKDGFLVMNDTIISVAYFRAGYAPSSYPSEVEWKGRARIESSMAIKCPSIGIHLAGTKKVQQILAQPNVLETLVDGEMAKKIRACFAGLWALDNEEIIKHALEEPQNYVLKPQREGGGNNIYDEDLVAALKRMSASERNAYILMERIRPPVVPAIIVRNGESTPEPVNCVQELGIFTVFLGQSATEMRVNVCAGHLLRTKSIQHADGGVAAGVAVMDSPLLYSNQH